MHGRVVAAAVVALAVLAVGGRETEPAQARAERAAASLVAADAAAPAVTGPLRVDGEPTPLPAPAATVEAPPPAPQPTAAAQPVQPAAGPGAPGAEGRHIATMRVARWGSDYAMPISEGISDHVLDNLGMGRFPSSQLPGEVGNFAVAGHRTDGSRPLARIDTLQLGDEIVVETAEVTYTYVVSGTEIVNPEDVRVVMPNPQTGGSDPVGSLMTLVACHPWDSSALRYVVWAELSGPESGPGRPTG